MTTTERLKRYKDRTGFTQDQLQCLMLTRVLYVIGWLAESEMRGEYLQTLLRFESDYLCGPKSPLSPAGRRAFAEGRHAKSA